MTEFISERAENNVEEGNNAVYLHFLFFPQCFQKSSSELGNHGIFLIKCSLFAT